MSRNLLILGGNGFIGAETVKQLIQTGKYDITVVNRGRWPWDYEETVKNHVKCIICDREKDDLASCFGDLVNVHYEAVIDFSGYVPQVVQKAIEFLDGRFGLYIYISTDSVYEVCAKSHDGLTREEDAVRPADLGEQQRLNEKDQYGHKKLECEELIVLEHEKRKFPYLFLRLCDVFGSRNSEEKWWQYQIWIKFYDVIAKPIYLPQQLADMPSSYVTNEDVARTVVAILESPNSAIYNQAFNLAWDDVFTLRQLLTDMMNEYGRNPNEIQFEDSMQYWFYFPSVKRGPISTEKSKRMLGFTTTPWREAFEKTFYFYEAALRNNAKDKEPVIEEMLREVVDETQHDQFRQAIAANCANESR